MPATSKKKATAKRPTKAVKSAAAKSKKWVYLFSEVAQAEKYAKSWEGVRGLLGGKGAGLADMNRGGLPVPPGFTVTTEACNAYLAAGEKFPAGMWDQEVAALKQVEKTTGKKFGDPKNPLLVSCRSGAKFSMPGMMDTVLNIGLNDETAVGMVALTKNERFVYDAYRRLMQMFSSVVMGTPKEDFEKVLETYRHKRGVTNDAELPVDDLKAITAEFKKIVRAKTGRDFPTDPMEQLKLATEAVFGSWNGKRAVDYRKAAKIAHDLGTAVNIVTMVFGNMGDDSGTGVLTTRNVSDGTKEIEGDFLINAQGEDVVSGTRQTMRIGEMKNRHAQDLRPAGEILPATGKILPRDAGHRIHDRARHPLDAANPERQTHRPGRDPDRGRHGRRETDHQGRSGLARATRARGFLPAPAIRRYPRRNTRPRAAI